MLCLVEQINQILGTHHQEIVSPGQAVKAMILNGLGLVSAPLYLFELAFTFTPVPHFIIFYRNASFFGNPRE
jgi:hypothetical protein